MKAKDFGMMMDEEVQTLTKVIISEWVTKDLKDLIIDSVDMENKTGTCNVDNIPKEVSPEDFTKYMKDLGFQVNIDDDVMWICWG